MSLAVTGRRSALPLFTRRCKSRGEITTDGPYAETKDIVIGYTVIEAKDLEQAVKLSTGCPLREDGGLVEVRPVMKL